MMEKEREENEREKERKRDVQIWENILIALIFFYNIAFGAAAKMSLKFNLLTAWKLKRKRDEDVNSLKERKKE